VQFLEALLVCPSDRSLDVGLRLVGPGLGLVAFMARAVRTFVSAVSALKRFGTATFEIALQLVGHTAFIHERKRGTA
jgi:hypothetical protein